MADALHLDLDFAHRFVYWQGASGRRYIHSVYGAGACPPLPGAVYVSVARGAGGERRPLAVGRFAAIDALNLACPSGGQGLDGADEIHVHLLAESQAECERILCDLARGLNLSPPRASPAPPAATAQLSLFPA